MALTDEDKRWLMEIFETFATKADLEGVETSLLTEFHKWAAPNEARQRRYSTELHEFELTLENHEDRLKKLEGPHGKA